MTRSDFPIRTPECPRCGYDLRGTAESWDDQCPLDGRCVECGLSFAWRDIFVHDAQAPAWCVEFAPAKGVPRATVATFALSFVPWRFWSAIRMTYGIRRRRLVLYALVLAGACIVLLALANGVVVYTEWRQLFGPGSGWTNTMSITEATTRAVLLPLSDEPLGTITSTQGYTVTFNSPRDLLPKWRGATRVLFYWFIVTLLGPVTLLGLRVSRRRAGIRPRHLARTYAYSLGSIPVMWAGGLAMMLPYYSDWFAINAPMRWFVHADYVMMYVLPVFTLLWWQAAARRYLHMEHSWAVGAAVMMLSMGGALLVMSIVDERMVVHIFERLGLA